MSPQAPSTSLALYSLTAGSAASQVISRYSTSFSLAASLLGRDDRAGIRSIYALVRIADEIVDGTAQEAGLRPAERREALDALEEETLYALRSGFSANLVAHAFAMTGRAAGIEASLVEAFFGSMRRDLEPVHSLSEEQYRRYVHGSAEVVGLMCLRVFLQGHTVHQDRRSQLESGAARLGAAFQKINFLRDLGEDAHQLGRAYFPGAVPGELSEARKIEILADIDADLVEARRAVAMLPQGPRRATALAAGLFEELAARLRRVSVAEIHRTRVSVPRRVKARILLTALASAPPGAAR